MEKVICFVCQMKEATHKAKTQQGSIIEMCDICFSIAVISWNLR